MRLRFSFLCHCFEDIIGTLHFHHQVNTLPHIQNIDLRHIFSFFFFFRSSKPVQHLEPLLYYLMLNDTELHYTYKKSLHVYICGMKRPVQKKTFMCTRPRL